MTNPLHAAHYADRAVQSAVPVIENVRLARDTYRIRLACPEIARRIQPGQFVMLRLAGFNDPLIGRPLALYDTVLSETGHPQAVDVVYLVKGKLTQRLVHYAAGQKIDLWGPLGNGFPPASCDHLVMVAGGIGQTPFLALAREALGQRRYGDPPRIGAASRRVTLCYGARTAELLAGLKDFSALGVELRLATGDGSQGHRGLVTDTLRQILEDDNGGLKIVSCGPEPMLEAVARLANDAQIPCQVSLETPMACGVGICFSCVAKVRDGAGGWDYKRTCVEGPVFDAAQIEW
jgi:dihydroorotate dehydrogenase electron transfer subunit